MHPADKTSLQLFSSGNAISWCWVWRLIANSHNLDYIITSGAGPAELWPAPACAATHCQQLETVGTWNHFICWPALVAALQRTRSIVGLSISVGLGGNRRWNNEDCIKTAAVAMAKLGVEMKPRLRS